MASSGGAAGARSTNEHRNEEPVLHGRTAAGARHGGLALQPPGLAVVLRPEEAAMAATGVPVRPRVVAGVGRGRVREAGPPALALRRAARAQPRLASALLRRQAPPRRPLRHRPPQRRHRRHHRRVQASECSRRQLAQTLPRVGALRNGLELQALGPQQTLK
jgi:hypothetical protein